MDAKPTDLLDYFGSARTFNIPVYQRNYAWKWSQAKKLIEDISNFGSDAYFIGASVLISHKEDVFDVIDGQQRITTVQLIFSALLERMFELKGRDMTIDDGELNRDVEKLQKLLFLSMTGEYKDTILRFRPNHQDNNDFAKLQSKIFVEASSIIKDTFKEYQHEKLDGETTLIATYKKIYDHFSKFSYDEVHNFIGRLKKTKIVKIELEENDDAQAIFESLNSTGEELSSVDLIRNFLLMQLENEQQNDIYQNYWKDIEETLILKELESAIKSFAQVKLKKDIKDDKRIIYQKFIDVRNKFYTWEFEKPFGTTENYKINKEVLKDLKVFVSAYDEIANPKEHEIFKDVIIGRYSNQIVWKPIYATLLFKAMKNQENYDNIFRSLTNLLENYWLRRMLSGKASAGGALQKASVAAANAIMEMDIIDGEFIIDKVAQLIIDSGDSTSFIFNSELIEISKRQNIYKLKDSAYLLGRIENSTSINSENFDFDSTYTVEHIAPQTPTKEYNVTNKEDYDMKIHRLGNLSLTTKNSEMGNNLDKKKIHTDNSKLILNEYNPKDFADNYDKAISDRTNKLIKGFIEAWPEEIFVKNKEVVMKNKYETVSITPDLTTKGKKIYSYKYKDEEINVSSWKKLYTSIISQVLNDEITTNNLLELKLTSGKKDNFSQSSTNMNSPVQIDDIFVETNLSSDNIIMFISKIFESFELDLTDLTIKILKKQL